MSYRVKSVLSGDVLILANKADSSEIQLNLAYVSSPRLAEPWGFEAREYLRQLCHSKPVTYTVAYESNGRKFGDLGSPIFKSLVAHLLSEGWCKLRNDSAGKAGFSELESFFVAAQEQAESKGLGIWSSKQPLHIHVRDQVPQNLYGSGRQIPAIVERVFSGDRITIRAMMDPDDHYVGLALLAGIKCQRTLGEDASTVGDAAADILSARLLQRQSVRVVFVAPAPHNEELPLVTLLHPQGDIALVLVSSGLAEVPNVPQIGADRLLQLKNAQRDAEQKGLGMHKATFQARKQHSQTYAHQVREASVVRVISSDTVVLHPGMEVVQLSSLRAPRKAESAEIAQEAREFTRKLLIGQTVRVQVDGQSSNQQLEQPRSLVTLSYGPQFGKNASLSIIKAGWATTARHSKTDLARSPFYDELLAAEQHAKESGVGLHSPNPKEGNKHAQLVDASETPVRSKAYLASLERKLKIPAVVEHVFSAGRLRLTVPSENCSLVAVLDGIQVQRGSDSYSEEALQYTLKEWNQRDVTFSVRSVDKTGAFVATLYRKSKSLAHELLALGYASIHEASANATGLRDEYDELQKKAQSSHLGIWANYDPSVEETPVEDATDSLANASISDSPSSPKYEDAILSFVSLDCLWLRLGPANSEYIKLKAGLKAFFSAASNTEARVFSKKPRRNDLVVISNTFERAQISGVRRGVDAAYEVDLIDSGERRLANSSELLPMPLEFGKAAPLAKRLVLRYVHKPVKLYEQQYLEYLKPFIGQSLVVLGDIVFTADSQRFDDSLNYRIVADGIASVPESQKDEKNAEAALDAQQKVKSSRKGMWEYGDPREDEDM